MSTPGPEMGDPHPDEVLAFVRDHERPFVSTSDVADQFNSVSRKTIINRLDKLEQRDRLDKEEIGGAAIWWIRCP